MVILCNVFILGNFKSILREYISQFAPVISVALVILIVKFFFYTQHRFLLDQSVLSYIRGMYIETYIYCTRNKYGD